MIPLLPRVLRALCLLLILSVGALARAEPARPAKLASLTAAPHPLAGLATRLVEDLPADQFGDRHWGPGNNPKTALREYLRRLREEGRLAADGEPLAYVVDERIESKLLVTVAPEGYLRRE